MRLTWVDNQGYGHTTKIDEAEAEAVTTALKELGLKFIIHKEVKQ